MNLFCGWMMPFMMLGGWTGALAGAVSPALGRMAAGAAGIFAGIFETVSMRAASFSHAIVRLPAPYPVTIFLFAILMMLLSRRIRFGKSRRPAAFALALVVAVSYLMRFNPQARYVQLDVGQGDAALFREGRRAVVIDAGPEDSYDLLRYLRHEGLYLEAVVFSHLDLDHAGALGMLLDSEIDVPVIVIPQGAKKPKEPVLSALERAKDEGVELYPAKRGDQLTAGSLSMQVIAPEKAEKDQNDQSLVLYAQMKDVSFLLTGDLSSKAEPDNLPACDVLKVAHHGSKNATSEKLLAQVKPKLALISVGEDNWYGHPSRETLERLAAAGAQILRTDVHGCITLRMSGGNISVSHDVTE